jgi:hypothetical protein
MQLQCSQPFQINFAKLDAGTKFPFLVRFYDKTVSILLPNKKKNASMPISSLPGTLSLVLSLCSNSLFSQQAAFEQTRIVKKPEF